MKTETPRPDHYGACKKIYEHGGQSAVFDYAKEHNLPWAFCKACECESPTDNRICLVCGQQTAQHTPGLNKGDTVEIFEMGRSKD